MHPRHLPVDSGMDSADHENLSSQALPIQPSTLIAADSTSSNSPQQGPIPEIPPSSESTSAKRDRERDELQNSLQGESLLNSMLTVMKTDELAEAAEEDMEKRCMPQIAFDTHDQESLSSLMDEARWKQNLKHILHLVDDGQIAGGALLPTRHDHERRASRILIVWGQGRAGDEEAHTGRYTHIFQGS